MASIRQRGGKKRFWHAQWRDADGSLCERSTKLTDRKKAQKQADEWEALSRSSAAEQTVKHLRKVIADLHRRYLGTEMPKMTVRTYADYWLKSRLNEIEDSSADFYEHALRLFITFLGPRADQDLFTISTEDIVRFRDHERNRVEGKSTNHALTVIKMMFRQAHKDHWTPEDPAAEVKKVKEGAKKRQEEDASESRRPFTVLEIRKLLAKAIELAPTHPRWKDWPEMIVRGYYTGQRLKDVALMRAEDEDVVKAQARFLTSKTGATVIVEMPEPYVNFVLGQPTTDNAKEFLHPYSAAIVRRKNKKGRSGRTATLSNHFARLLAAAGLREKMPTKKREGGLGRSGRRRKFGLSFHSLRHSMVSHLQDAGVARAVVQDMVGHENEAVNRLYTHLDRQTKRDAMAKLPNITGIDIK